MSLTPEEQLRREKRCAQWLRIIILPPLSLALLMLLMMIGLLLFLNPPLYSLKPFDCPEYKDWMDDDLSDRSWGGGEYLQGPLKPAWLEIFQFLYEDEYLFIGDQIYAVFEDMGLLDVGIGGHYINRRFFAVSQIYIYWRAGQLDQLSEETRLYILEELEPTYGYASLGEAARAPYLKALELYGGENFYKIPCSWLEQLITDPAPPT